MELQSLSERRIFERPRDDYKYIDARDRELVETALIVLDARRMKLNPPALTHTTTTVTHPKVFYRLLRDARRRVSSLRVALLCTLLENPFWQRCSYVWSYPWN
jgi:hypothetical protein